jgi:uncharacterized membrane protein
MNAHPEPSERVERILSTLLRTGVLISLGLVALGLIIAFAQSDVRPGEGAAHTSIAAIVSGLAHLRGAAFIMLGLLTLIATPVLRVAMSILVFIAERDRAFALITALVLTLLLFSFVVGGEGG